MVCLNLQYILFILIYFAASTTCIICQVIICQAKFNNSAKCNVYIFLNCKCKSNKVVVCFLFCLLHFQFAPERKIEIEITFNTLLNSQN